MWTMVFFLHHYLTNIDEVAKSHILAKIDFSELSIHEGFGRCCMPKFDFLRGRQL